MLKNKRKILYGVIAGVISAGILIYIYQRDGIWVMLGLVAVIISVIIFYAIINRLFNDEKK